MRKQIAVLAVTIWLLLVFAAQNVKSQNLTTVEVMVTPNTARIGETITVNVTIANVQNLYGFDIILNWNNSLLELISTNSLLGVESHPGGVLHETIEAPISIVEDNASQQTGKYHLVATSQSPAPSFNGTGTVTTLTFNVTDVGHSTFTVESELADRPLPEDTSEFINHTNVNSSVDTIIPEFPEILMIALLIAATTFAMIASKKWRKTGSEEINIH